MADIVTANSHVNLTQRPVICAVSTDHPLPPQAWAIVGELAYAVEKAADRLNTLGIEATEDDVT